MYILSKTVFCGFDRCLCRSLSVCLSGREWPTILSATAFMWKETRRAHFFFFFGRTVLLGSRGLTCVVICDQNVHQHGRQEGAIHCWAVCVGGGGGGGGEGGWSLCGVWSVHSVSACLHRPVVMLGWYSGTDLSCPPVNLGFVLTRSLKREWTVSRPGLQLSPCIY